MVDIYIFFPNILNYNVRFSWIFDVLAKFDKFFYFNHAIFFITLGVSGSI